jgi:hypothetical protein
MSEFAYCFAIDHKVNWSSETAESLMHRMKNDDDRALTQDFIETATPGSFITISSGELVFCVKATAEPSKSLNPLEISRV